MKLLVKQTIRTLLVLFRYKISSNILPLLSKIALMNHQINFKQQIHHQMDVLFQGLFAVHISSQQIMRIIFPPPSFLHGLAFVKTDVYFRFPCQKQLSKSP